MVTRFTDDIKHNIEGNDFIVRTRRPLVLQLILIFVVAFLAIYFTGAINSIGNNPLFLTTLVVIIGSLGWFTIFFARSHRDLVMATEFQNAMLASAAQLSTRFCLITKRDGFIVYVDQGFQKLFPYFMRSDCRTIDGLFTHAGIAEEVNKKIIALLTENKGESIVMQIKNEASELTPMLLVIDILPRPKGYFLFRGRDYVEKRHSDTMQTDTTTENVLLARALDAMPAGMLIATPAGVITYANRTLEAWLGYTPGEMSRLPITMGQLIYQYTGSAVGRMILGDYASEAQLQCKNRTLVTANIKQTLMRDGEKTAGISALITLPETVK